MPAVRSAAPAPSMPAWKLALPAAVLGGHRKVCSQNYSKGPKHLDSDFNASSLRFCKPLPCLFRAVWRLDRVTIRPR